MLLTDIPRVKAGSVVADKPLGNSERDVLAKEAAQKLGYTPLRDDAAGSTSLGVLTGKLTETLLRLELEPLDTAHVLRYQIEEAGRITLEKIHERFQDWVVGWFSAATWAHSELSTYKQPIPEFVIRKAIQIKDVLPEVMFYVHHLTEPKADPFLVACLGGEIYYLEAWDEPRFESQI